MSPLKYVDGAWLGHINRITTPFLFRCVIKNAWQVLSEEYGDGDLDKHHANIYHKLMREVAPELPGADELAFTDSCHGLDDVSVWRAAVAQLIMSLFPHDFLPEILGYNLHFESIKLETLMVARELREVGIDPYYFTLHVSIDNADSGHTAMALNTAEQYLHVTESAFGTDAKRRAWRRVQAGFVLSEYLEEHNSFAPDLDQQLLSGTATEAERNVIKIIRTKAAWSDKIHCASNLRLGGRKLAEWLDPAFLTTSQEHQIEFVRRLAASRFWVHPGSSEKSRLVKELSWGGCMFGAFTNTEVEVVRAWIESLSTNDKDISHHYWSFTERPVDSVDEPFYPGDVLADYAAFLPSTAPLSIPLPPLLLKVSSTLGETSVSAGDGNRVTKQQRWQSRPGTSQLGVQVAAADMTKLLPLWFTHTCLLQPLVSVPFRARTRSRCALLRLLRAQAGFDVESAGVAGMDEVLRGEVVGIVELGLQMSATRGLTTLRSPADAIRRWPSEASDVMCRLSLSPNLNAGLLIGLAWAFVDLHDAMASTRHSHLLPRKGRDILSIIARRERECLVECIDELKGEGEIVYGQVFQAHAWGSNILEDCFH